MRLRTLLVAALTSLLPSVLAAQAIPQFRYSVTNNTAVVLSCRLQVAGGDFEPLMIEPGAEWNDLAQARDTVARISCQPPVRQAVYPVVPGQRYRFLRNNPNARIRLRREQGS